SALYQQVKKMMKNVTRRLKSFWKRHSSNRTIGRCHAPTLRSRKSAPSSPGSTKRRIRLSAPQRAVLRGNTHQPGGCFTFSGNEILDVSMAVLLLIENSTYNGGPASGILVGFAMGGALVPGR